MSLLKGRIQASYFETIRDRIGAILADEISTQFTTYGDTDLQLTVWNSRFIPFDKTEVPAVNVNFFRGDYTAYDQESTTAVYKYSIDCYSKAKTTVTYPLDRGDSRAMFRMNKILGVCRTILDDPQYRTLLFPPPSISTTWGEALDIANPMGHDAESIVMGREIFNVRVNDIGSLLIADLLKGQDTKVKIELTDKGYFYRVNEYA